MDAEFEKFKEDVRAASDIVQVISEYVPLKKRGQNFWGCCPFHGEKTPSFAVNPAKNMFYCFGCHEGGDLFKFIMKIDNCGFVDALKILAGRYGIPVPEQHKSASDIKREEEKQRVAQTNALACQFFQACLLKTAAGKAASAYLDARGIGEKIIADFSIGYAPDAFEALIKNLGRKGTDAAALLEAGLIAEGRNGFYDKFRNRVMIPIKDARGKIVGFGGRVLDNATPKYLNTAETAWFNKRRLLFALDVAQKEIRAQKFAIVVEGYMDAISLHAADIKNVVASMGTAFSEEQAKLLARFAQNVVFCYDSDSAGRKASVRAVSVARAAALAVRVAGVPEGKDPDEYVRRYGKDAFQNVIAAAADGMDFQITEIISESDASNLAGKIAAVSNTIPFLFECKNEIEVAAQVRKLAQRLTIDEGLIMDEYRKAKRKRFGYAGAGAQPPPERRDVLKMNATREAQEQLLAVLLEYPHLADSCEAMARQSGWCDPALMQIYSYLAAMAEENVFTIDKLNDALDSEAQSVLAGIRAREVPLEDAKKFVQDCLRQLERLYLEQEYERHRLAADEYERSGDERFYDELRRAQEIQREIKKLYQPKAK